MLFYDDLEAFLHGQQEKLEALRKAHLPAVGRIVELLHPGPDQDKAADVANYSVTSPVEHLFIDSLGISADRHRQHYRPSTARERALYPKGTPIRQHRHLFAVSPGDCATLSTRLGVKITPGMLGANVVIAREDDEPYSLSALPEGTHLVVAPADATLVPRPPLATLVMYAMQQGCGITGNAIAQHYGDGELTRRFIAASQDSRGIVCRIEHPVEYQERLVVGQQVFFKFSTGIAP
jgi:hypothetical protein